MCEDGLIARMFENINNILFLKIVGKLKMSLRKALISKDIQSFKDTIKDILNG